MPASDDGRVGRVNDLKLELHQPESPLKPRRGRQAACAPVEKTVKNGVDYPFLQVDFPAVV